MMATVRNKHIDTTNSSSIDNERMSLITHMNVRSENSHESDSEKGNGPSVTLGNYVTDRVYVGVEQDLTSAKQDVVVEITVTPNFTVESKAGTKSGAGLGFNWNYDY